MTAPTPERLDEIINVVGYTARHGSGAWFALALGTDDYNDLLAALRAYRDLHREATIVANAIAVGAGACIKDTLMEKDFRDAIGLTNNATAVAGER